MTLGFSFVFPFLLVMAVWQRGTMLFHRDLRGWRPALILCLISALITIIPVGGLPVGRWLISFNANFSITLTAALLCKIVENFSGTRLLDEKAFLMCWGFSISAGVILYPMALGLGRFDPYPAGWAFSWLFVGMCAFTATLLAMKNRFAIVLIADIFAYNLGLLESTNLWDYLLDPILVLVSCIALGRRFLRNMFHRH